MRKTFLLLMLAGAARAQVNFEHGDWRALREQSRFLQPIHPLPLWGTGTARPKDEKVGVGAANQPPDDKTPHLFTYI